MSDDFDGELRAWRRSLRAQNKSPKTIKAYVDEGGTQFAEWLRGGPYPDSGVAEGEWPTSFSQAGKPELEEFFAYLYSVGRSDSTVATRYRALQQLYRWLLEDEEEIDRSPFDRMKPPFVAEKDVEVLEVDTMQRLLAVCKVAKGAPYTDRFAGLRDEALIRLVYDTGGRCAEVMGVQMDNLDMETEVILVHGKGRRDRSIPFGNRTGAALDRYLRSRSKHPRSRESALWIGRLGPMTDSGLRQMLDRRTAQAGLPHIHPHQLRHSSVDAFLAAGGQETDAMRLFGWSSREMVARYASATGKRRAHEAKRRLSPGDKI